MKYLLLNSFRIFIGNVLKKINKIAGIMKEFQDVKKWKPEGQGGILLAPQFGFFLWEECFDQGERLEEARLPRSRLAIEVLDFCRCQSLWSR